MALPLLCVCLGNTCRSPMAAALLTARGIAAASAGTAPRREGAPADPRAIAAAAARGLDLSAHRSRALAPADFAAHRLILAMDRTTLAAAEALRPPGQGTPLRLFHPEGLDIADPWAGGPADYARALALIAAASAAWA